MRNLLCDRLEDDRKLAVLKPYRDRDAAKFSAKLVITLDGTSRALISSSHSTSNIFHNWACDGVCGAAASKAVRDKD